MDFHIMHIESLDSTNNYAMDFVEHGKSKDGLVIWADEQTAGRGYGQNIWQSEKGQNLTFSLLLKPDFILPSRQFLITQIVSLALQSEISQLTGKNNISIKWPNDLYAGSRKLAGMLIQHIIRGNQIDYSVIGIGLNVNQQVFDPSLPNPVSLSNLTNRFFDLNILLDNLLQSIQKYYSQAKSESGITTIEHQYLEKLYLRDEWANYQSGNQSFVAKIKGFGPFGQLVLELENGEGKTFGFKEVELIN